MDEKCAQHLFVSLSNVGASNGQNEALLELLNYLRSPRGLIRIIRGIVCARATSLVFKGSAYSTPSLELSTAQFHIRRVDISMYRKCILS